MFNSIGRFVAHRRVLVLVVTILAVALIAGAGALFGKPFTQGGFEDPNSDWAVAESLEQEAYGRDAMGDVVVLYHAPEGTDVDDPAFLDPIAQSLDRIRTGYPDQVTGITSYTDTRAPALVNRDEGVVAASIQLAGVDEEILRNFREIENDIPVEGTQTQISGLQPVAGALDQGMTNDLKRAELIALPLVFLLLVVVFGGLVAASLPVLIGVLTILGALGLLELLGIVYPVNAFSHNVVTLIGLGLAIDYGLFVVSRFREEMRAGYEPRDAARRSVASAGRTVVFSAVMVGATLSGLLIFPQQFLKSVALGAVASVLIAAVLSVTLLPALLALLGHRVDWLSVTNLLGRISPKLRREPDTAHAVAPGEETGFFARIADWSMRRPIAVALPIVIVLLLLILPFSGVKFGGINETYLPPHNDTRVAQEAYDQAFPDSRTDPVKLVIVGADSNQVTQIRDAANQAPGLVDHFSFARSGGQAEGQEITVLQASVQDRNKAEETVEYLQKFPIPDGTTVHVGGNPALEYDSVQALLDGLPYFVVYVLLTTTVLLFLSFGSLVLPIKAAIMNVLGLGATLGVLTWIFVDGHGAELLGFTAGPLTSPVVVLLVAIIYGLSTDYEVFLLSRMVEARTAGASTQVAIRSGTARTGQIITSAALILIVVTGAFAFSEIVMMKYIAFGMMAALILDATVIRLLLVPAVMRLLGSDCWWAPQWMKRIQHKIGLSEAELVDEPHLRRGAPVDAHHGAPDPAAADEAPAAAPADDSQPPLNDDRRADSHGDRDTAAASGPATGPGAGAMTAAGAAAAAPAAGRLVDRPGDQAAADREARDPRTEPGRPAATQPETKRPAATQPETKRPAATGRPTARRTHDDDADTYGRHHGTENSISAAELIARLRGENK